MNPILKYNYSATVRTIYHSLFLLQYFVPKIKTFLAGYRIQLQNTKEISSFNNTIWFHCASLGEYEVAKRLIQKLSIEHNGSIVVSFFSPSGLLHVDHQDELIDGFFYSPLDLPSHIVRFLAYIKPRMVVIQKNEIWPNLLNELSKRKIPTFYLAASFKRDNFWLRNDFSWAHVRSLLDVRCFFVQTETTANILRKRGIKNIRMVGDPRVDQVIEYRNENRTLPLIESFCKGGKALVFASTHQEDSIIFSSLIEASSDIPTIVIPHEVDRPSVMKLASELKGNVALYSEMESGGTTGHPILLVDRVGLLPHIYKYASIAYIGGGFGKGIHNILEAVVQGVPVFFGPNYSSFEEANQLIREQGAFSINNAKEAHSILIRLGNPEVYEATRQILLNYIQANRGATSKIYTYLQTNNYL